jgi:hypothetical protein
MWRWSQILSSDKFFLSSMVSSSHNTRTHPNPSILYYDSPQLVKYSKKFYSVLLGECENRSLLLLLRNTLPSATSNPEAKVPLIDSLERGKSGTPLLEQNDSSANGLKNRTPIWPHIKLVQGNFQRTLPLQSYIFYF